MIKIVDNPFMHIIDRPEQVMIRGEGSYLWDAEGKRYLDFIQGWAVNSLGHSPPELRRALAQQADLLLTSSPALHNAPALELGKRLRSLSGLHRIVFGSTGAEATETALKICRKWGKDTGRHQVIAAYDGFHGRTLAAMALSGKPGWNALFPPVMPGFQKVPFGDLAALSRAITRETVAVFLEPIQGEAGVVLPPPQYLASVRELTQKHDMLLVFDEVQTGMRRTGPFFAGIGEGVVPDVMTLGKGLGGGIPLSAVLVNQRADCLTLGDHGGTFLNHPLSTSAGLAVLDVLESPGFEAEVLARGRCLAEGLAGLARRYGGQVRGRGLLLAWVLPGETANLVRDRCHAAGLLVNAARPNILRFMPQLRVTDTEISEMLRLLTEAVKDAQASAAL